MVHLSGDKWVNTERICSISKEIRNDEREWSDQKQVVVIRTVYVLWFESNKMVLSTEQGEQLLHSLNQPKQYSVYDADRYWKRGRAERTLIGQMGKTRWDALGDDEQIDAISAEVEAQEQMGAQSKHEASA